MIYTVLWIFMIYSVIGWVVEVAFHAVTLGKVVNRGFLNGPLCPVYGTGILTVFFVLDLVASVTGLNVDITSMNVWALFLVGIIFATLVELVSGWLLNKFFHARWWDYRDRPFNLNGYICLEFSIIWGLGIAFVLRVVHPEILDFIDWIPHVAGIVLMVICYLVFAVDIVLTVLSVLKMNRELEKMQQLQNAILALSDGMSEVIGNTTLKTIEKVEDGKQIAEEVITESKQKAEEVITESKQKADDMIVDMIAAGEEYREGYQESVATGKQALADMKDELEAAILHMQNSLKYHRVFGVGRVLDSLAKFDREKYQDLLDKIKRHVV